MITKQISVFIENRKGRLGHILDVLKEKDVNILSMSLSDTSEYGLLRILSDKPMLTDIFILKIPHTPGSLQRILRVISDEELNVEYMYGLSVAGNDASIVIKTSDLEKADEIFARHGIETLSYENL